jgi:hypothetical protein
MRPFFLERTRALHRSLVDFNLTDRALVYHMEYGPRQPGGAPREQFQVTDYEDHPCRLAPTSLRLPIEIGIAEQFGADVKWVVIFSAGTNIREDSRLKITGVAAGVPWEKKLEVIAQLIRESEMYRHVACKELPEAKQ